MVHISEKQPYSNGGSDTDLEKKASRASSIGGNGLTKEQLQLEREMGLADEEEGVKRGLKQRHISMIALGGTIGTGLFIGLGNAISTAGPVSTFIGYCIMGSVVYCLMTAIGEMGSLFPVAGGFIAFATRWADPAVGFSTGWAYWYSYGITLPTELSAASLVVQFWDPNQTINPAVWISLLFVAVVLVNSVGSVRFFGETEFWFSLTKVIAIVVLIITGIVIDLGGTPRHDRIGFRYWKPNNPGPFAQLFWEPDPVTGEPTGGISGSLGRFLAFWQVFVQASFSFAGTEIVGLALAEVENPRKNVPKAIRRVFWRILLFYVLSIFVVGLIVPYNDPRLLSGGSDASASPFVIAIDNARIKVLPHIINAVLIIVTWSAANSDLYSASRALYGLALERKAPAIFRRCLKNGIPIYAVAATALYGPLAYMGIGAVGAAKAFIYLYNLSAISIIIVWIIILGTYLRFYYACKVQGVDRGQFPYRAPFQPYGSWFAFFFLILVLLFSDFTVFLNGHWDTASFVTNYLSLPLIIVVWAIFKIVKKTKTPALRELDLTTGRKKLEEEDEETRVPPPTTIWGKFWDWLM